jgi:hypothetical protein
LSQVDVRPPEEVADSPVETESVPTEIPRNETSGTPEGTGEAVEIRQDQAVCVLGPRGSGKSELIKALVRNLLSEYHFIILDVVGNLREFEGNPNCRYYLVNPHNQSEIDNVLSALKSGEGMVVMDEADRYQFPIGATKKNILSDVVNLGRNYGIGYIISARRTSNLSKDFIANENWSFVFRHEYPNDVEVLCGWFNRDPAFFMSLPKYTFAIFHDGRFVNLGILDL